MLAIGIAAPPGDGARAQAEIDISGDWAITLVLFADLEYDPCSASIQQVGSDVFAAMSCPGDTFGILRGSVDPGSKRFGLSGILSGQPTAIDGLVGEDSASAEGEWSATYIPLEGTFTAVREDRSPSLIDVTGTWDVVLEPLEAAPPEAAFSDECVANIEQVGDELTATLDCDELGSATMEGQIHPHAAERSLNLASPPGSPTGRLLAIAAPGGGFILGVWSNHDQSLEASLRAIRTSGPTGDVNCSASVNSVDGALLLQHDAGLIDALACPEFADANGDGSVDSVDASIVLQRVAGFLALFL